MTVTTLMASILNWLRAGYPDGVPGPDQVPLLALLRATPLTEEQVQEVVRNIAEVAAPADIEEPITRDDIEASISEVTNHDAGPENTARVAAKLAAAGWPLADLAGQEPALPVEPGLFVGLQALPLLGALVGPGLLEPLARCGARYPVQHVAQPLRWLGRFPLGQSGAQ